MITENEYAHWLFNVPGLGNRSIDKLLCSGMNCKEIYEADVKEFKGILTPARIKSLENSKRSWDFELEAKKLKDKGISFIPRIDKRFPEKLKNIPDPPFAIYVKGNLPDPEKPSVAIIGARLCSDYGRQMARTFGRGLALAGVQVISGMARGIDGISQKAAIEAGGNSYGIVGCGADYIYPPENKPIYEQLCLSGGVISEYPPGTEPKANFFPMRNRIISGLADIVLVIEAREKSGTQITVDTALEQGREVLAVPGRVTDRLSDGCNLLISQGAGVAISVSDVLERLSHFASVQKEKSEIEAKDCSNTSSGNYNDPFDNFTEKEPEKTLDDEILDLIDIIPVSASNIIEGLNSRDIDISIPQLMTKLMDLTYKGLILQEGVYFRKKA
ncbi:DNA-processing protein DprA [Butyrivibrio sp. INlla14]|uniref:DNA-processing protein DprA n=1 Tax=Butyrivibrio sp. INlla14 TaxID=1520808 RepID=UPI0008770542|nr:DNA-processing protein DprA [Butyrivibrio sp. INlla14]SCY08775.1 DNA processing protein [Butyrivibrio sp. INlla14]